MRCLHCSIDKQRVFLVMISNDLLNPGIEQVHGIFSVVIKYILVQVKISQIRLGFVVIILINESSWQKKQETLDENLQFHLPSIQKLNEILDFEANILLCRIQHAIWKYHSVWKCSKKSDLNKLTFQQDEFGSLVIEDVLGTKFYSKVFL